MPTPSDPVDRRLAELTSSLAALADAAHVSREHFRRTGETAEKLGRNLAELQEQSHRAIRDLLVSFHFWGKSLEERAKALAAADGAPRPPGPPSWARAVGQAQRVSGVGSGGLTGGAPLRVLDQRTLTGKLARLPGPFVPGSAAGEEARARAAAEAAARPVVRADGTKEHKVDYRRYPLGRGARVMTYDRSPESAPPVRVGYGLRGPGMFDPRGSSYAAGRLPKVPVAPLATTPAAAGGFGTSLSGASMAAGTFAAGIGVAVAAAQSFAMVLTGLVQAASPNVWRTFSGSVELLMARMGQDVVPGFVRLSMVTQKLAEDWESLSPEFRSGMAEVLEASLPLGRALSGLGETVKTLDLTFRTVFSRDTSLWQKAQGLFYGLTNALPSFGRGWMDPQGPKSFLKDVKTNEPRISATESVWENLQLGFLRETDLQRAMLKENQQSNNYLASIDGHLSQMAKRRPGE